MLHHYFKLLHNDVVLLHQFTNVLHHYLWILHNGVVLLHEFPNMLHHCIGLYTVCKYVASLPVAIA